VLIHEQASDVVRPLFNGQKLNFRVITLREPSKDELVKYLEAEHQRGHALPSISRCARVEIIVMGSKEKNSLMELIVDLGKTAVVKQQHLEGKHSYIDSAYMNDVEEACLANSEVQAEIQTLDLPAGATVIVEPWAYATDGSNDMSCRISMVTPHKSHIRLVETDLGYSVGFTFVFCRTQMRITTLTL
jgi:primary-amine oxidase